MTHEKLRRLRPVVLERARTLSKKLDWEMPGGGQS
jgi:hypothetical protein